MRTPIGRIAQLSGAHHEAPVAGWSAVVSLAVIVGVPIAFWIAALQATGALAGFAVESWMRAAIVGIALAFIVPIWAGLWL